jgi:hypothetical protein
LQAQKSQAGTGRGFSAVAAIETNELEFVLRQIKGEAFCSQFPLHVFTFLMVIIIIRGFVQKNH